MNREKQIPPQNMVSDQWIFIDPDGSHPKEKSDQEQRIPPRRKIRVGDEGRKVNQELTLS